MANEYGRWFVRNDPQTWRKQFGAYNRPFSERYQRPAEYTPGVEEYSHYPAMKSIVAEQEEKKKQSERNDESKQSDKIKRQSRTAQNMGRNVGNIVKNVVGRAVAVVGGSAVVVSGYQAIVAERAKSIEPVPIVEVVATWDDWNVSDTTITLQLKDAEGNVVKEIPAEITLTEVSATCTKAGSKTYTATAEDDGKEYSDSYIYTVEPIGHKFDGGKVETDENGNSVIVFECSECHEKFEVSASATENDDEESDAEEND